MANIGYKTKTEFQKRLMSENNINKYKTMCIVMLKDDDDCKKMCEFCGITPNTYEQFIENNFFSDKIFLYKLEALLNLDSSKQKKEKFFKEEIKKFFELKALDIQYEHKMNKLHSSIEKHIMNIKNYEFFK